MPSNDFDERFAYPDGIMLIPLALVIVPMLGQYSHIVIVLNAASPRSAATVVFPYSGSALIWSLMYDSSVAQSSFDGSFQSEPSFPHTFTASS